MAGEVRTRPTHCDSTLLNSAQLRATGRSTAREWWATREKNHVLLHKTHRSLDGTNTHTTSFYVMKAIKHADTMPCDDKPTESTANHIVTLLLANGRALGTALMAARLIADGVADVSRVEDLFTFHCTDSCLAQ